MQPCTALHRLVQPCTAFHSLVRPYTALHGRAFIHSFVQKRLEEGPSLAPLRAGIGMWCDTCNRHRPNKRVIGFGMAKNPLKVPTDNYRLEIVDGHERRGFHAHAVSIDTLRSADSVDKLGNILHVCL